MVVAGGDCEGGSYGMLLSPMTKADEPNEMEVPEIVMADAPGVNVVPAMEIPLPSGTGPKA